MDPYLEHPGLWPDVHHRFISAASEILQEQLGAKYIVRVEERVYLADQDEILLSQRVPDIQVAKRDQKPSGFAQSKAFSPTAVLDEPQPIEVPVESMDAVHEPRLNIIRRDNRSVVTVIEVLSPTNKTQGTFGRDNYMLKRPEVLESNSHLVEIDLLREGIALVQSPLVPSYEYRVHVNKRVEDGRRMWVWPVRLQQKLPRIFIPLHAEEPDAHLDLQQVLNTVYSRAKYDFEIDYSKDPSPPLDPALAEWARAVVQAKR